MSGFPHLHEAGERPPELLRYSVNWPCRPCRVAFTASILRGRMPHPLFAESHLEKGRLWLSLDYDPLLAQALDALERHMVSEAVPA